MADVRQILKQIKDPEHPDNNLHAHITNVTAKLMLDNPKNAFTVFEEYSQRVKETGFSLNSLHDEHSANRFREPYKQINDQAQKLTTFIGKIMTGTPDDPQEPGPTGYVPNTLEEMKLFEQIGIYFGEELTYILHKSLTRLAIDKQVKKVRLWGKIHGSQRDYFVAEGVAEGAAEDGELPPNVETRGSGVNKLNYWVTNDPLEPWIELPILHPKHIVQSRRIKHIFTGNLEADVISNPAFPGKEKHLLKCQIVRIAHSTTLVPKGLYKVKEDDPRDVEDEEEGKAQLPAPNDIASLENWLHNTPAILKEGRLVHFEVEVPEDQDKEVFMKKIVDKDPFEDRLKPLSKDKPLAGAAKAWSIRVLGDTRYYANRDKKEAINLGIVAIKSQIWPGSVTLYSSKQWTSFYLGYGFKGTGTNYAFENPHYVQSEPADKEEFVVIFPAEKEKDPAQADKGADKQDDDAKGDDGADGDNQ